MNKKVIVGIAVVLLILAGAYFLMGKKQSPNSQDSSGTSGKSLKELLTLGIAQKCTFSTGSDTSGEMGTTYISGGKLRGDFTANINGKSVQSHMIVVSDTSYIWTDGEKTGFKSTFKASPVPGTSDAVDSAKSGLDINKQGDYKCSTWVTDESYFVPPSDVKFSDFSEIMTNPAIPGNSGDAGSQCSVCESLSGDDKAQCRTALSCK